MRGDRRRRKGWWSGIGGNRRGSRVDTRLAHRAGLRVGAAVRVLLHIATPKPKNKKMRSNAFSHARFQNFARVSPYPLHASTGQGAGPFPPPIRACVARRTPRTIEARARKQQRALQKASKNHRGQDEECEGQPPGPGRDPKVDGAATRDAYDAYHRRARSVQLLAS